MNFSKLWIFLIGTLFTATVAQSQEVTLNVLEWEGYISPYVKEFDAYAKKHGKNIKLNILQPYITNPEQIFETVRSGAADIVTPTVNYYKMEKEKLLKILYPIDFNKLTNYKKVLASLRNADYDKLEGKKYSVPLVGGSYGLAYNANINKTAPTSWNILWDEKYKGKYAVTDDQFEANIYNTMLVMGYSPESIYDIEKTKFDEEKVQAKLDLLVKNAKTFWPGESATDFPKMTQDLELVTTYWLGIAFSNKAGQNWKLANPKEGETVWLDTLAINDQVKNDPAKLEAAHLLLDFMISEATQVQLFNDYGLIIVNVETAKLLPPEKVKEGRIGDETFFKPAFFWRELTARTRNTYKKMWNRAKEHAGTPEVKKVQ